MKNFRIAAGLAALLALSGCLKDSTGEKAGSVTRLSEDGWIPLCKTWEGEIIRGGLSNGSGVLGGAAFHFTVEGNDLIQQVKQSLESQKEVKIHYHHEKFVLLGSCSSKSDGYFLDSIEIIR
jgi:hypothetical protein